MAMRWFLALILIVPGLAGCLSDSGPESLAGGPDASRVPVREWMAGLSEPRFDSLVESIHRITAEDGTELALTLFLPSGLPADEPVPTLLELTPYQTLGRGPALVLGGGPGGSWGEVVLRGAAFVRADARGTHGSEGCLDFGGSADRSDARLFADWIRAQPWSNGVVVTDGVSHPGMGSVVAHVADPLLTGALAHAPVVSYYQDEWLQGAKFEDQLNGYAYQAIELAPHTNLDSSEAGLAQAAPCTGRTAIDYAPVDGQFLELWQDRDLALQVERGEYAPTAPILLTHGFVDLNVHPDHTQLYWDALPDDAPKYMILGWWYHGWPDMDGHPAGKFSDIRHRWLDATVLGLDNGLWAEPRVLVEDSQGTWHESHDWPLDGSQEVVLMAGSDGSLASADAPAGEMSYTDTPGARRGEWADAHVAFRSAPMEEPRIISGTPTVELVASSSEAATKWVVYLMDEAPDGSWQRVSHGYADSRLAQPRTDSWGAPAAGEKGNWTIPLMPTAVVVEEGHRLTLVVASQDSRRSLAGPMESRPCFDDYRRGCYNPSGILPADSVGRAENTLFTGPDGTRIRFHSGDPHATALASR